MKKSGVYTFGRARARSLLSVIEGLREDQVDAIAHDMGLEFERVLDGVTEAMSQAVLAQSHARGERLTMRQARQRIRSLLEG